MCWCCTYIYWCYITHNSYDGAAGLVLVSCCFYIGIVGVCHNNESSENGALGGVAATAT